jgi:hypothetical protein
VCWVLGEGTCWCARPRVGVLGPLAVLGWCGVWCAGAGAGAGLVCVCAGVAGVGGCWLAAPWRAQPRTALHTTLTPPTPYPHRSHTAHTPHTPPAPPPPRPAGAGKTNVAMLCVLHEMGLHRSAASGEIDTAAFKIVYVAPMKALVAEMVRGWVVAGWGWRVMGWRVVGAAG